MCRNIKSLYNFEPHATDTEIRDAALQFVRKISGFREPSRLNEEAFNTGIDDIAKATHTLLASLTTQAEPRNREQEVAKIRARTIQRFGTN